MLDAALGTELESRGYRAPAPLWSAEALLDGGAVVRDIHDAHLAAGAEVLVTNTFRTAERAVTSAGLPAEDARHLSTLAVRHAKEAAGGKALVAGSIAPLEDCWRPDLTPAEPALSREHAAHAAILAEAGCDILLAETHHKLAELVAAVNGGVRTGLPTWASVSLEDGRLRSGETMEQAIRAALAAGAAAVLVNCSSVDDIRSAIPALAAAGVPWGAEPNHGHDSGTGLWQHGGEDATPLTLLTAALVEAGAQLIGTCCGTTPAHLAQVAATVRALSRA